MQSTSIRPDDEDGDTPSFSSAIPAANNEAMPSTRRRRRRRRRIVVVVATRIHLDQATVPPTNLDALVSNFYNGVCVQCRQSLDNCTGKDDEDGLDTTEVHVSGVVAVDATDRIPGYNLVDAVQQAAAGLPAAPDGVPPLTILPVQPWGKFVPALNALLTVAAATAATMDAAAAAAEEDDPPHSTTTATWILFCSAETKASAFALATLHNHMDNNNKEDTLVCGALLPGHDYYGPSTTKTSNDNTVTTNQRFDPEGVATQLNGRTTPWNTLALWNVRKLALTGFSTISDGLLDDNSIGGSMAGVEEVVIIALLQRLLGPENAKAKVIRIVQPDLDATASGTFTAATPPAAALEWNPTFADPARQKWHEKKMQSKMTRAARQLELMGLNGIVHHF